MKYSQSTSTCSQCRSLLILISRVTEKIDGSRFPQTKSEYRCSNKDCQEEIDKQTAKRIKLIEQKTLADQQKAEARMQEKQMHMAIAQNEK